MKQFFKVRNILVLFALALVMVAFTKTNKAMAAEGIAEVSYVEESVTIKAVTDASLVGKPVYFAVIKTVQDTTVKTANLELATMESDEKAYVDFSSLASTKAVYIGYVIDPDLTAATVTVYPVTVNPSFSKVKFTMDYSAENIDDGLVDVFSKIEITDSAKVLSTYTKDASGKFMKDTTEFDISSLEWKKGVNGAWTKADKLTSYVFESLKKSGATLYVRTKGDEVNDIRASKEVKIKISKQAKAPVTKVTTASGVVAVKNGMQISNDGKTWIDIYAYNKTATATDYIGTVSGVTTKTKIAGLSIEEIGEQLDLTITAASKFYVRTAATTKKYASKTGTVTLKAMPEMTVVSGSAASGSSITVEAVSGKAVFTFSTDLKKTYEYILVKSADVDVPTDGGVYVAVSGCSVNIVKSKWIAAKLVTSKLTVKATAAYKYFENGSDVALTLTATDADYILVREKGSTTTYPSQVYIFKVK